MDSFRRRIGSGRYLVEATVVRCGSDINVTIGGGEKYHIGAVAIAVPRNEYKDGKKRTSSTSVICVQGHREDELSYKAAKYLSTHLDCTVVMTIGIHLDYIKSDEFKLLFDSIDILLENIIESVNKNFV